MGQNNVAGQLAKPSWTDSYAAGVLLAVAYLLLADLLVALAFALSFHTEKSWLRDLGKSAALIGFAVLALQIALSSRLRLVDRPFGLDVVMQFHKYMAIFAGVLLITHPILHPS